MNEIIKKNGINYGVITAAVGIGLTLIAYLVDLSIMTKWWFGISYWCFIL